MATKVKYTQPLFGEANAAGYLILVPGASVLIRQNGVATTVYASNAGAAMTNPVPTGVSPGTAGVDVNGTLTVYLEPGTGYDGVATVGGTSSTFTIGDISPTSADVQAPIPAGTYVEMIALAGNPDLLIAGAITRDANDAATSAPVVWPDGTAGTYTATSVSTAFPGAVDAYTITYGSPVTLTYTQPAVTRNANGAVTIRPAITVS